jgi:hypothetical protein
MLIAGDFRKRARGPYAFDRWLAVPPLDTPLGRFDVELRQMPDSDLLATANALAGFLVGNPDAVSAAVHDDYVAHSYDEGWMEDCEIPMGLAAAGILRYLEDSTIMVDRTGDGHTRGVIYFSPLWDPEHGVVPYGHRRPCRPDRTITVRKVRFSGRNRCSAEPREPEDSFQ